jgi:hypothetical protein
MGGGSGDFFNGGSLPMGGSASKFNTGGFSNPSYPMSQRQVTVEQSTPVISNEKFKMLVIPPWDDDQKSDRPNHPGFPIPWKPWDDFAPSRPNHPGFPIPWNLLDDSPLKGGIRANVGERADLAQNNSEHLTQKSGWISLIEHLATEIHLHIEDPNKDKPDMS